MHVSLLYVITLGCSSEILVLEMPEKGLNTLITEELYSVLAYSFCYELDLIRCLLNKGELENLKLLLWKAKVIFLGHCIYYMTAVVVSVGCNLRFSEVKKDFVVLIHADSTQQ